MLHKNKSPRSWKGQSRDPPVQGTGAKRSCLAMPRIESPKGSASTAANTQEHMGRRKPVSWQWSCARKALSWELVPTATCSWLCLTASAHLGSHQLRTVMASGHTAQSPLLWHAQVPDKWPSLWEGWREKQAVLELEDIWDSFHDFFP